MRRWLPFYILLAVVLVVTLFSLQLVFAQTDPSAPPAGKTVQVQRSDTLAGLAARFNKPVACLQIANKLDLTNFSLAGLTTILVPDDCDKVLASIKPATPTPESAESLATATFTPIATAGTPKPVATATMTTTPSAFATFVTPIGTTVADQIYTVVNGDRLSKIAASFGLTVECIVNANNIPNPDLIYPGQQLQISANCIGGSGGGVVSPVVTSSGNPQACQYDRNPGRAAPNNSYTVQPGDSLDFIACDFNISLQCLKDSNPQLGGVSLLAPGQSLNINFSCPVWRDSSLPPVK